MTTTTFSLGNQQKELLFFNHNSLVLLVVHIKGHKVAGQRVVGYTVTSKEPLAKLKDQE
jgi:hypothetical protein